MSHQNKIEEKGTACAGRWISTERWTLIGAGEKACLRAQGLHTAAVGRVRRKGESTADAASVRACGVTEGSEGTGGGHPRGLSGPSGRHMVEIKPESRIHIPGLETGHFV